MEKTEGNAILVLAITASMLLSIVMIAPTSAQATTIGLEPDKIIGVARQAGSTFTVEVWVRNVVNLAGAEFRLGYNTTVLTATSIEYGGIFGESYFLWISSMNEAEGWLHYSITENFGEDPTSVDGIVATITFTVDSYGSCTLDLYGTALADNSPIPNPIEHTAIDGYFSNKLAGDVDGDGDVDYDDFIVLAGAYGSIKGQPAYRENADFDHDGDVDYDDFILLAGNYGKSMP